jgi:SAM-dependent methyltransferase
MRTRLFTGIAALTFGVSATLGSAAHADRNACDRDYKPQVGQAGKDVVWVPTPDELVQKMLSMARVTPQDIVYDLGAGDGKIAIAAGKAGATAVGIEYNPQMAKLAQCYVEADGLANRVKIINGDIFKEDFTRATVVTMYLLPDLNIRLRPIILNMRPGTRVTSHQFTMGDWEADETAQFDFRSAYLWIVPAKVDGAWTLSEQGGSGATHSVNFTQTYQKVGGDVQSGASRQPLAGSLRGEAIAFAFNDERGVTRTFNGTVRGNRLDGVIKGADGSETRVVGTRGR